MFIKGYEIKKKLITSTAFTEERSVRTDNI
jgi:hypothetical protein